MITKNKKKKKEMFRFFAVFFCFLCLVALTISLTVVFLDGSRHSSHNRNGHREYGVLNLTGLAQLTEDVFLERDSNSTEITLYIVNHANSTRNTTRSGPPSTACCSFLGNYGHWNDRDMPVRVYQDETLVPLVRFVDDDWAAKTQIDLTGDILETQDSLTNTRRNIDWNAGINVVGYQSLGDDRILAVTALRFTDDTLTHIRNSAISFNSDVPNICNAANDASCYDRRGIYNHEVGHKYGMADQYEDQCELKLMYWQLSPGDTRTRTIDFTSLSCVNELYEGFPPYV